MYAPFPIYDFQSGFRTDKEPWLLPQEAFQELHNAHLQHGRVEKRRGYEFFARLAGSLETPEENLGAVPDGATAIGFASPDFASIPPSTVLAPLSQTPVAAPSGDYTIEFHISQYFFRAFIKFGTHPTRWFLEPWDGGVGAPLANVFGAAIDLANGEWWIFLAGPGTPFEAGDAMVFYRSGEFNPVTLIHEFVNEQGVGGLIACDTRKLYRYNAGSAQFVEVVQASDFNMSERDYFSIAVAPFAGALNLVLTNGVDVPRRWDGTTLQNVPTAIVGGGTFESALHVFYQGGYLVYLRPTRNGVTQHQHAIWSNHFEPGVIDISNEAEASTSERIVSAAFLKGQIIVLFERSVWKLEFTGDFRSAFEWRHVAGGRFAKSDTLGAAAAHGIIALPDRLVALGRHSLVQTDGESVASASETLPDLVNTLNHEEVDQANAAVLDETRHALITFASLESEVVDRALGIDLASGGHFTYGIPLRVFGLYRATDTVPNWDDAFPGLTWDEVDDPPDAFGLRAGFPIVLGGDAQGAIYRFLHGFADDGADVAMRMRTRRLNPLLDPTQQRPVPRNALLGWIDLFLDAVPMTELRLQLFENYQSAPYQTHVIPLDPDGAEGRVWRRVNVYRNARHHEIAFDTTSARKCVIHAVVPWFDDGGPLEQL